MAFPTPPPIHKLPAPVCADCELECGSDCECECHQKRPPTSRTVAAKAQLDTNLREKNPFSKSRKFVSRKKIERGPADNDDLPSRPGTSASTSRRGSPPRDSPQVPGWYSSYVSSIAKPLSLRGDTTGGWSRFYFAREARPGPSLRSAGAASGLFGTIWLKLPYPVAGAGYSMGRGHLDARLTPRGLLP